MARKLTTRQKLFVQEYLVDLNATRAAIRAGYSEKTSSRIGPELIGKPWILAAVQESMAQRSRRLEITQDKVLNELAAVAFANGADFASVATESGVVTFVPTEKLTPEKKKAISSISEGKFGTEVKTYDKIRALELLGKHLGMFNDRGGTQTQESNNLLEAIKNSTEVNTDAIPEAE